MPANDHDWPEDDHLENGNYECECMVCGVHFTGYKRRVVCRLCDAIRRASAELSAADPAGD